MIRLIYSCILALSLMSCSQQPLVLQTPETPPPPFQKAKLYYDNSKPIKAITLLKNYLNSHSNELPDVKKAQQLLGDIYFSMQSFKLARNHYALAKAIDSDDYTSLHRYWSASLLANTDDSTKSKIRAEINKLASNPEISSNELLAVYSGYAKLWDSKGTQASLAKLMRASRTAQVDENLPYLLMEEMVGVRSTEVALNYARLFLSRYASHINLPIIAAMLFSRPIKMTDVDAIIKDFVVDKPYNPYLEFHIAKYLATKEQDNGRSFKNSQKLVRYIESLELKECPTDENFANCIYFRKKLIGDSFTLYATFLTKQKKPLQAVKYATIASNIYPESHTTWRILSRLLHNQEKFIEADTAMVNSLNLKPDSELSLNLFDFENQRRAKNRDHAKILLAKKLQIPHFTDVSKTNGLTNIKAYSVAWGDVNNDGFDDILFDGSTLMLNRQGQGFEDISKASGLRNDKDISGGLFIDFDNDGHLDILSTGKTTVLHQNNGDTTFSVVHRFNKESPRNIAAASWGNFNNDAYLDLYLANYEKPAPERAICDHDQLFINNNGISFSDLSGLPNEIDPYRLCSRGVLWTDLNQDGQQEIIVSSYRLHRNRLFLIDPDNSFRDISYPSKFQPSLNGQSIAAVSGDFNGDGKLDIYQTNLAHPRYLQFSDTSHLFLNKSTSNEIIFSLAENTGILFDETNSDITTADFDNDGDLDLFITSIYPNRYSTLYLNDGLGRFRNVSWLSNSQVGNGWGTASADFDNDGDSDILVASQDGVRLLQNDSLTNSSLKVSVNSDKCQRNGIGVKLWLSKGPVTYFREIQAGKGTGSQDSASILFGLGNYLGELKLRAIDICGNEYEWSGSSDVKSISIF